eukprot:CFRG1295T1
MEHKGFHVDDLWGSSSSSPRTHIAPPGPQNDLMSLVDSKKRKLASSSTSFDHNRGSAGGRDNNPGARQRLDMQDSEMSIMRKELASLRTALSAAEAKVEVTNRVLARTQEAMDKANALHQRELDKRDLKIQEANIHADDMQSKCDIAIQRQMDLREEIQEVEKQSRALQKAREQDKRAYDGEVCSLKQEMLQLRANNRQSTSVLSQSLSVNTLKSRLSEEGVAAMAAELSVLQQRVKADALLAVENVKLEEELQNIRKSGTGALNTSEPSNTARDTDEYIAIMQKQLKKYRSTEVEFTNIQKENDRLRAKCESDAILNTKIRDLEAALERATQRENRLLAEKVQYEGTMSNNQKGGFTETALISIMDIVSQLRETKATQDEKLKQLSSKLSTMRQTMDSQRSELDEYTIAKTDAALELKEIQSKYGLLERKQHFNRLEVKGMQEILNSFYKQDKVFGHQNDAYLLHAQKLDEALQRLHTELDEERARSSVISSERDSAISKCENTQELLNALEKSVALDAEKLRQEAVILSNDMGERESVLECATVKLQLDQVATQLAQAQEELRKYRVNPKPLPTSGETATDSCALDYDPHTTKVLHMRTNPTVSEREKVQQDLMDEVSRLKEELSRVHPDGGGADGMASIKMMDENRGLREQLKTATNRNNVIKQMFSKNFDQFREVVFTLFGFKIDMDELHRYKLRSLYADSPDDYLLFKGSDGSGRVDLLETEYSNQMSGKIEAYLGTCRSIPAFLSSITLDLFQNQTFRM